jgi:polysaccharide export outer membrane protein
LRLKIKQALQNYIKMKQIKAFALLLGVVVLASCASQKRVIYLQDAQADEQIKIAQDYQIRIKPLDRLTVVVNSRDPELAAPFNTSTSFNSLTGTPLSTYSSNATSLQIRTVDEDGNLDMPIIGPIQCKGKTRSELAQEIADKIREGGYISDPTVNIQFADMKISVIGEVARPGQYDITNDRISLLDALSLAGDLTIYGVRSDVKVIREENGVRTTASLDLTSQDIYDSPYFYLQQNDVIYVKPNKYRAQAGEISQNRSFYISLISTAVSVATLIVTLTR